VSKNTDSYMVRYQGVGKRFGNVVAVEKMDLGIAEGSLVTLLGPSGCGKTTLLRMIAGLEEPSEGEIFVNGKRINDIPIHKRNLGMIFQNYALFPHKTIFDNVAFGLKYRNVPKPEIRKKVARALEMVRLPGVENRYPSQLSGGQQQRIALARAIVIEPDVLLMDEPLSALDENLREEMRWEIDNLQRMIGVTTIFVTHDQREALSMSDKIVVMKDGRKLQEGSPEEVYNYPVNHFVADFLGHSNFIQAEVVGADGQWMRVRLGEGSEIVTDPSGQWSPGDAVEVVVRAQKFIIEPQENHTPRPGCNSFSGRVRELSYMGGEVRYFVELDSGAELHVIGMVRAQPYRRDTRVVMQVEPQHCRLLAKEKIEN
jgi:spermidine/putrescine ABC transporter ATP-binding subunit